jgi:CheY-like chemotaxis protein
VILSRMLESYGLQVDAAESAEQAFEFLSHQRPDVIFMDHLMPGMDGFQAVQVLKGMAPILMPYLEPASGGVCGTLSTAIESKPEHVIKPAGARQPEQQPVEPQGNT